MVTVVGAPLGVSTFFLLFISLYFAQAYAAAYIGREILGTPTSASQALVRLALGLALIYVGKAIPYVSFFVFVLVALWGFGALAAYVKASLDSKPTTTTAAPPAAEPAEA